MVQVISGCSCTPLVRSVRNSGACDSLTTVSDSILVLI